MIGDTHAQQWLRAHPPLPPAPRRRRTYRVIWACMGIAAVIEILIGVFVP